MEYQQPTIEIFLFKEEVVRTSYFAEDDFDDFEDFTE